MKQSQGLGLLRFARNDCKYFCPSTYYSVKRFELKIGFGEKASLRDAVRERRERQPNG
ncbi:hypothetical protein NIES2107_53210 [Nostoc carneum NIES-2107]|nr:hypothetical protein NIES2107_53210 [Nostoc carneum NIES-2107]